MQADLKAHFKGRCNNQFLNFDFKFKTELQVSLWGCSFSRNAQFLLLTSCNEWQHSVTKMQQNYLGVGRSYIKYIQTPRSY